jgi:tetraacyldisaccharide 4'-kinase
MPTSPEESSAQARTHNGTLASQQRWNERWYGAGRPAPAWVLLSLVYGAARWLNALPWRLGLRRAQALEVPVLVVGNLTVGGTGKTPLVIALVEELRARGHRVGVISRGYGRRTKGVCPVDSTSTAAEVGDEPWLIARKTRAPVVVGEDRVAACKRLAGLVPLDLVISDDGLEHWALARRAEIVVVDGARGFGNGQLLPAGPLRAPLSRLRGVTALVRNGGTAEPGEFAMELQPTHLIALSNGREEGLRNWHGRQAHVVAGTGNPDRVFASVRALGIDVIEHALPDHVDYRVAGVPEFADGLPVITTEKDASKLDPRPGWYVLKVAAKLPVEFYDLICDRTGLNDPPPAPKPRPWERV